MDERYSNVQKAPLHTPSLEEVAGGNVHLDFTEKIIIENWLVLIIAHFIRLGGIACVVIVKGTRIPVSIKQSLIPWGIITRTEDGGGWAKKSITNYGLSTTSSGRFIN